MKWKNLFRGSGIRAIRASGIESILSRGVEALTVRPQNRFEIAVGYKAPGAVQDFLQKIICKKVRSWKCLHRLHRAVMLTRKGRLLGLLRTKLGLCKGVSNSVVWVMA